jgi:hypothetical protein
MCPSTADPAGQVAAADDRRLGDLEAAEAKRAESGRLDHKFELFEAILLSIAALLAAWTGFQAAKWSGVQANSYSQAGASRVESTRESTLAGQESTVDVISFTQWLQAAEAEGVLAELVQSDTTYVPDPNVVSGFLYQRFRPEFKVAVDAWVATNPRVNPNAQLGVRKRGLESGQRDSQVIRMRVLRWRRTDAPPVEGHCTERRRSTQSVVDRPLAAGARRVTVPLAWNGEPVATTDAPLSGSYHSAETRGPESLPSAKPVSREVGM